MSGGEERRGCPEDTITDDSEGGVHDLRVSAYIAEELVRSICREMQKRRFIVDIVGRTRVYERRCCRAVLILIV